MLETHIRLNAKWPLRVPSSIIIVLNIRFRVNSISTFSFGRDSVAEGNLYPSYPPRLEIFIYDSTLERRIFSDYSRNMKKWIELKM